VGAELFQICDYPLIESYDHDQLSRLRVHADDLGVALELGTRGVRPSHLGAYLELAQALDVTLVRSMINTADHRPGVDEAVGLLREILPRYEAAGVTVALETYEQVPVDTLINIVQQVDSPALGICLDPGNCVAALETPTSTIERTAPYVRNLHVKDFAFSRKDGWVGFTFAGSPLGEGLLDYDFMIDTVRPDEAGHQPDHRTLAALARRQCHYLPTRRPVDAGQPSLSKEQAIVTTAVATDQLTIAVIGAGGKMGMRVSNNLQRSNHNVFYSENSPAGQQRTTDAGRTVTDTATAVADADVVILAVPDVALSPVSAEVVPQLKTGTVVLTLDPAAAYANLLFQRDDVEYAVAHPCHPSVFLQRKTEAELNDTFGGIAAPQEVVAALESGNQDKIKIAEAVIR
jgi:L-ribulose-5-phosphate 3-epimerase UlaE